MMHHFGYRPIYPSNLIDSNDIQAHRSHITPNNIFRLSARICDGFGLFPFILAIIVLQSNHCDPELKCPSACLQPAVPSMPPKSSGSPLLDFPRDSQHWHPGLPLHLQVDSDSILWVQTYLSSWLSGETRMKQRWEHVGKGLGSSQYSLGLHVQIEAVGETFHACIVWRALWISVEDVSR